MFNLILSRALLFLSGGVAAGRKLPKELDRNHVVLVDTLGKGEFGEV